MAKKQNSYPTFFIANPTTEVEKANNEYLTVATTAFVGETKARAAWDALAVAAAKSGAKMGGKFSY